MGNGATFDPWLNDWLLRIDNSKNRINRVNLISELEKREHPVPSGPKEMQVSQNLFLLEAGCSAAFYGKLDAPYEERLITRLKRERDELGLWGSECTSPIYHHFIITGLSAIYHNTNNSELKDLIEQNLGSFFWYALKMGLADSKHGLIGMRGTGHDIATGGFPHLHFICNYFTVGRPTNYKKLESWKDWLSGSGWLMAGLPGERSYELYKKVFEYAVDDNWKPWRLRGKLTLVRNWWKNTPKTSAASFYESGINGNTPCLIAYVDPSSTGYEDGYLPVNASTRMRQQHDNSHAKMKIENNSLIVEYDGAYESLHGAPNNQYRSYGPLSSAYSTSPLVIESMTSDLSGVSNWTQIYPSKSVPDPYVPLPTEPSNNPNPKPRKKKRWWEFWK